MAGTGKKQSKSSIFWKQELRQDRCVTTLQEKSASAPDDLVALLHAQPPTILARLAQPVAIRYTLTHF